MPEHLMKDRSLHEAISQERRDCLQIAIRIRNKYRAWGSEIAASVANEIAEEIEGRSDDA